MPTAWSCISFDEYKDFFILMNYPVNERFKYEGSLFGNFTIFRRRIPVNISNQNARTRWKICSKLTIKTQMRRQWCQSSVSIVHFEYVCAFWDRAFQAIVHETPSEF